MTFTEFLEWIEFLDQEEKRDTKQDYYLAQIAATIVRVNINSKDQKKVKLKDYLLRFVDPPSPDQEEKMKKSKSVWLSALRIKPKK